MNQENLQRLIDILNQNKNIGIVAVNNYVNVDGEKSKRRVNVVYGYEKIKSDDLAVLRDGVEYVPSEKYSRADWDMAVAELIEGIVNPNEKRSKAVTEAFVNLTENGALKYCYNTQELYISGLEITGTKTVVEEGEKKNVKSAPKTIAKNVIRKAYLKAGKIRLFKVREIGEIKLKGEELELG